MNPEKRYCTKCGKEMMVKVEIESYNLYTGIPEYRAFYKCPNRKLIEFSGHEKRIRDLGPREI